MELSKLLRDVKYKNSIKDINIEHVTCDSRQIEEDSLFVCIKGLKFDGHEHAKKAVEKGAKIVICEKDLGLDCQIIVENSRHAYAVICANFFGNPSRKLNLIGITGTNGKTTITYIIKHILENAGEKVGLIGTIHNEINDITLPAKHTTPDAFQLHSMFARMVKAGCKYVVMEVSSHALDQYRLAGCNFKVGVFTNLTQDHLDYHKTMENYFNAKKKLFEMADIAIINYDDEYGKRLIEEFKNKSMTFSTCDTMADYTAKGIKIKFDGSHFSLLGNSVIGRVNFCMPGIYSVSNALGAASCAIALGVDFDTVVEGLNSCKGVSGRTEIIKTNTDYCVIRDYAHSPDGLEKIISSVREYADENRIVVLFGCAGNRDRTKRAKMAEIVSRLSDFAILTSDNPRDEEVMQIINDAKEGLLVHDTPYEIIPDRYKAIKWALDNSKKDDILILAGKGHENYQVLDYGTIYFDEKVIVQELLGVED